MSVKCTRLNTLKRRCKETTVISRCLRAWVSAYVTICFVRCVCAFGYFYHVCCICYALYILVFFAIKCSTQTKLQLPLPIAKKTAYNVMCQTSPDRTQNIKPPVAALLCWIRRNHTTQLKGCTWTQAEGKNENPFGSSPTGSLYLQL